MEELRLILEEVNSELETARTRDWLDMQVKIRRMQEESFRLNDRVVGDTPSGLGVYMDRGVDYIAELLGLEMHERYRGEAVDYPWEYSFIYNGVRFFGIFDKRVGKYAEGEGQGVSDGQVPADAGAV